MPAKLKSTLILVLKIALAAALIVYMVKAGHLDPKELLSLMTPLNIAVALALVGLNIASAAWRWVLLMRARGLEIKLAYGFQLYLIGIFFNHALPGAVGGDVVRGYYVVSDYPGHKADTILSIFIDRILGLYSFFILTLVAVVFDFDFVSSHDKIRWVALMCAGVFAALTLIFTVAFSTRLSNALGLRWLESRIPKLHRILVAFQGFGDNKRVLALSICVSLAGQLVTMVFFYSIALVTQETAITWMAVLFAVPMGFLVSALPLAPAGIGVGQVAFGYLFQAYLDKPTSFGATAITAFQLTTVAWAMLGAFFYLSRRKPKELEE